MARHRSPNQHAGTASDLRSRVERARTQGRFQSALELAKQLHRQEATPEHRELLFECYLGRAKELNDRGATRDAGTVLENALAIADSVPAKQLRVAEALVACGQIQRGLQIAEWLPEPRPETQLLMQAADVAVRHGAQGRALLPEKLQPDFDRIRNAFDHLAAGRDDDAKQALQGIALQSPFLEWKLLARGFLAYYGNDDIRAIDNWSRLDTGRLPARLAAPFRFSIDEAFRTAQPPATQRSLHALADNAGDNPVLRGLRKTQDCFSKHQGLNEAFREAETLKAQLQQQAPHLIPKLATCFYWQIIEQGQPDDMRRYVRAFGMPHDDPNFHRLSALVTESAQDLAQAHHHWQLYEKAIANHPTLWPEPEGKIARAMIWLRLGANAEEQDRIVGTQDVRELQFARPFQARTKLEPGAEKCYRMAADLAPDWVEPHRALFQYFHLSSKIPAALVAGKQLLDRFPDDHETLVALGAIHKERGEFDAAKSMLERALAANPLELGLRDELGHVEMRRGTQHMSKGQFDRARIAFNTALSLVLPGRRIHVHCRQAACEFLARNGERAEELLQQAGTSDAERPVRAALMLALATQHKLAKPLKARFDHEFKEVLDAAPTPALVARLGLLFADYQNDGVEYFGQKAQQKKVIKLIERTLGMAYTEDEMRQAGMALLALDSPRLLRKFALRWQRQFPKNPYPVYFELESHLTGDESRWPVWQLRPMVQHAQSLAEDWPNVGQKAALLKALELRAEQFHDLSPFASVFDAFAHRFRTADEAWEDDDPW